MESNVYNQKGEETDKITLPEAVFGLPWNGDLVHQVVVSMMSSARHPIAHTKNRGDVSGGGKKPWQQKGTGRARHGSIRSPLWVGGGVTHGPRNDKNFERKVNKKMKSKALFTILSKKQKQGEIIFIDEILLPEAKTKHAIGVLKTLSTIPNFEKISKKPKNALYLLAPKEKMLRMQRAFGNIGSMEVDAQENLNPLKLLKYKYLGVAFPDEFLKVMEGKQKALRNQKRKAEKIKGKV
ncbi:MAG: 50S ribosomal protein L4 [Candidatus Taylorbacteria bacterium]